MSIKLFPDASAFERDASALNTRPAAPVEGLDTVQPLYGPKTHVCWTPDNTPIQDRELVQLMPEGDYVTRSQAEELLAAERVRAEVAEQDANEQSNAIISLQADNAALTARVKELEEYFAKCISNETFLEQDARRVRQIEALEAKLAAARTALEAIEDHAARCETLSYHSSTAVAYLKDIQQEARAALEGKP